MKTKMISQWIYGSTPWSAGYSVLAQSEGLKSSLTDAVLAFCENYDGQKYMLPLYHYNCCIYHIQKEVWVFMETFGGWKDQVGRDSRVIRNTLMDQETFEAIQGNPFLLSWVLPSISSYIPKKRNETKAIPGIPLESIQKKQANLWYKETQLFFRLFASLSVLEKQFLLSLQQKASPFSPCEIAVQKDASKLSRAIVYAIHKNKRMNYQIDSFSTNSQPVQGICFRFAPYCQEHQAMDSLVSTTKLDSKLGWEMATLVHSLPEPEAFYVMAKRYTKFSWIPYLALFILILTFMAYCLAMRIK